MNHLINLGVIYAIFLVLIYFIWIKLRVVTAYVGFDESRAGEENYFLCDGVADNVQIQAAIDYVTMHPIKKFVRLGANTFSIEAPIEINCSHLTSSGGFLRCSETSTREET